MTNILVEVTEKILVDLEPTTDHQHKDAEKVITEKQTNKHKWEQKDEPEKEKTNYYRMVVVIMALDYQLLNSDAIGF